MRAALILAMVFCLPADTDRLHPNTRHYVKDADFMQSALNIQLLYQSEVAILTSIQNEGSK